MIYEGLCSRTPLIVSDHPMFGTWFCSGEARLVFPAGDVGAIVASIERLQDDPAYHAMLSDHAEEVCARYMIGAPGDELIEHWLAGTAADRASLADRTLDSPRFR